MTRKTQNSTRRQERTEETINLLKEVALELIEEGGIAAMTFATLAKRAGFSTSIVAYHFGSKANFVQYLLDDALERNSAIYTETLKGENVADEFDELFDLIGQATRDTPRAIHGSLALISSVSRSSPELLEAVEKYNRRVRKIIEDVLEAGKNSGSVDRNIDASALATAIVGSIRGIVMQAAIDKTVDIDAAFDAYAHGLRRSLNGA